MNAFGEAIALPTGFSSHVLLALSAQAPKSDWEVRLLLLGRWCEVTGRVGC